jgi:hypothetical protein
LLGNGIVEIAVDNPLVDVRTGARHADVRLGGLRNRHCLEEDKRGSWPRWFYSKLNRNKPNKKYGKYIFMENIFHQQGSNSHPEGIKSLLPSTSYITQLLRFWARSSRTHPEDGSGHEGSRRTGTCIGERGTRSLTVTLLTVPQPGHLASFRPGATLLPLASPRPHIHRTARTPLLFYGPFFNGLVLIFPKLVPV